MIEVKWGNLGMKDQYCKLLSTKWKVSLLSALIFGLGAVVLVHQALEGNFGFWYAAVMVVWFFLVAFMGLVIKYYNRHINGIEHFLGVYEQRHELRHEVFCKHHGHCMGLHYFKRFD